jgi:hypothetical protein
MNAEWVLEPAAVWLRSVQREAAWRLRMRTTRWPIAPDAHRDDLNDQITATDSHVRDVEIRLA